MVIGESVNHTCYEIEKEISMKTFLSTSCGPIRHPNSEAWRWIHIDHEQGHNPDICCDVTTELKDHFTPMSVDVVENCHGVEHYDYPLGVNRFLNQAFFVLKPGGILRIAVPDLEKVARAYVEGSNLKFIYEDYENAFLHKDSAAERFWQFMHLWEHRIAFDFPLLASFVQDAGFTSIRKAGFNDSEIPGWTHDRYQSESLYLEARRP